MDPVLDDGVAELLEIIRRTEDDEGTRGGATNRIESLPRTSADFESCRLRSLLCGRLEADLGATVDAVLYSDELRFDIVDGVRKNAIDGAVAGLTSSQPFVEVVDTARAAIERAAPSIAADNNAAGPGAAGGSFLRRNLDALSSSDTEREGMHVKKKAARRNDWMDIFDKSGGLGGSLGFSPRVDVEAALAQLEAGLGNPGGSPSSSVEALGLLAEADPELFQFGNHWNPFLKLARQALGSADPVVHAKAMTLHWVMYEKSMGMCAADMCEGVLDHAREYFSNTIHLLSATSTHQHHTEASAKSGGSLDISINNPIVIGDSKLSCAAREARALHGMLVTIHETFQHLPDRRVWSIVGSFFSLLGDAVTSLGRIPAHREQIGGNSSIDPDCPLATSGRRDLTSAVLILPAHFLAVAGRVDEWLPNWLRSVPTGRLVRAVNDAGLLGEMARRCDLRGRIPFSQKPSYLRSSRPDLAVTGTDAPPCSGVHALGPLEACQPEAALVWHRLSASSGSSGTLCSVGSATPLARALWLSAAKLDRSLLLQSVSFLGILVTHCRGALQPCPPPSDGESGSEDEVPKGESQGEASETEAGFGLERGKEVLHALVQCACTRETDKAQPPVRSVALGYIGKLAKATAGSKSTPFTASTIDRLFSTLLCERSNVGGQDGSAGEKNSNDRKDGSVAGTPQAVLVALAEIAGVIMSSRGASAGFFVDGPEGPRASRALLGLVRCTAELAKCACRHGFASGKGENGQGRGEEGGEPECQFRLLGREDCERLAVDFACALATITCRPPKERAAAWKAMWRFGVPCALAELVAHLSRPGSDETTSRAGHLQQASGQDGQFVEGTGGSGASCNHESAKARQKNGLRDRLLLSLVDWARDLAGVSCLRRVGLVGPCGAFLARELGRHHLNTCTRDECADYRPVAIAMRIALCPEGLNSILSSDGDVAGGVASGLARLSELISLPELLQCQTVGLPPPNVLVACKANNSCGGAVREPAAGEAPVRSARLELGGDVKDLRCLDFIGRMSLTGRSCFSPGNTEPGAVQMRRWLRWALRRSALSGGGRVDADDVGTKGTGEEEEDEEGGDVPQDVRVAALQLAANLAADLTIAVTIEAEWSLADSLALRQDHGEPAGACVEDHSDLVGDIVGRAVFEDSFGPGELYRGAQNGGCSQVGVGGIVNVPELVEPAALARARLAVMLTCLGGPNEERHKLLKELRRAEASAGGAIVASGVPNSLATSPKPASGAHKTRERVEFPGDDVPDKDWWGVAARCVAQVISLLSDPRSVRRTEAFKLLRKAAARGSPLLPQGATERPAGYGGMDCTFPKGDEERRGPTVEGDSTHSRQAVMAKLCFSYARSLGFVDDGCRERFDVGLRSILAGAAGLATSLACPSPVATTRTAIPPQADCDWFTAVVFIASNADSEQATELLQDLHRHTPKAIFLLPLAGERSAAQQAASESTGYATIPGSCPMEDTPRFLEGARGRAHGMTEVPRGRSTPVPSHLVGNAASAGLSRGDPPLLLLLALVEELLDEELPLLSAALRSSGWAPAALAERWMRQCMLCVVDWPGVVAYLTVALLRGYDYQVYFVVALFRTAQPSVLEAASRGLNLMALLGRGDALEGFDLGESLRFMQGLEMRHRERCLAATRAYLAQR